MLILNTYHPLKFTSLAFELSVQKGEIVGITGHSGSGKTTLLRQIAGLSIPEKGTITFNNTPWTSEGKLITTIQDRKVGFVFQDYGLFPHLTALQNIEISNNNLENEIAEALELTNFLSQKPNTLSGGQKQRVAIARALNSKAQLLLMDEPFSALDEIMKAKSLQLLKNQHAKQQQTLIIVSHDVSALQAVCETIYTLQENSNSTKLVNYHG